MAEPWDEIKDQVFSIIKDSLKGFVEKAEVDEFIKEKAQQYAKEWWGSTHAPTDAEKDEHKANLEHLKAQTKAEVARLQIQISVDAKNTIIRILEAVGGMLIKVAPTLIAAI